MSLNVLAIICVMLAILPALNAATADSYGLRLSVISKNAAGFCNVKGRSASRNDAVVKMLKIRGGSSSVKHIASAEEFDRLLMDAESAGKLVVVDFSAAWCMPCKLIAPVFEEMSSPDGEFANVIFIKIDVDEVPELAERFQVQAMPTFLFMRDNEEIDRFSGASVEKLKETIVAHSS